MDEEEVITFSDLDEMNKYYSTVEIELDESPQEIVETTLKRKNETIQNEENIKSKKSRLEEMLQDIDFDEIIDSQDEEIPEVEIHENPIIEIVDEDIEKKSIENVNKEIKNEKTNKRIFKTKDNKILPKSSITPIRTRKDDKEKKKQLKEQYQKLLEENEMINEIPEDNEDEESINNDDKAEEEMDTNQLSIITEEDKKFIGDLESNKKKNKKINIF